MRSLEILLLIVSLPFAIRYLWASRKFPFWFDAIPLLSFLLFLVHTGSEGARWSMGPAYGVTILLFLSSTIPIVRSTPLSESPRRVLGVLSCLGLAVSLVLSTALPVFTLPPPSGDFHVGVSTYLVQPEEGQPIPIRIWYPTDEAGSSPYVDREQTAASFFETQLGLPGTLAQFGFVRTQSKVEADLSDVLPTYPVVVHSHDGSVGFPEMHTSLLQDLASRGYVVMGIDPVRATRVDDSVSVEQATEVDVSVEADAAEAVLDWLEAVSPDNALGWLADRVDLGRVAYVGHGTGGGAAFLACRESVSFGAGVSIGGELGDELPTRPFMAFESRMGGATSEPFAGAPEVGYLVGVEGSGLFSFTDLPFWSPLIPIRFDIGPLGPGRAHRICSTYVFAFLNSVLNRGVAEPLLEGPSPDFPEVKIQIHPGQAE